MQKDFQQWPPCARNKIYIEYVWAGTLAKLMTQPRKNCLEFCTLRRRRRNSFKALLEKKPEERDFTNENRMLLMSMMMTTCDLSSITKPWEVQQKVRLLGLHAVLITTLVTITKTVNFIEYAFFLGRVMATSFRGLEVPGSYRQFQSTMVTHWNTTKSDLWLSSASLSGSFSV